MEMSLLSYFAKHFAGGDENDNIHETGDKPDQLEKQKAG